MRRKRRDSGLGRLLANFVRFRFCAMILPMTRTETKSASEGPAAPARRFIPAWVLPVLFRPQRVFRQIAAAGAENWLTPVLILMSLAGLRAAAAGPMRQAALGALFAASGEGLPVDGGGPVAAYVIPAAIAALEVWVSWMGLTAVIHLVLTFWGGGGTVRQTMNLVAWASLPLALRDVVRLVYFLVAQQFIRAPGLAGLVPSEGRVWMILMLSGVDIYWLWQALLLAVGVRAGHAVGWGKAGAIVALALLQLLTFQALGGWALARLGFLSLWQLVF